MNRRKYLNIAHIFLIIAISTGCRKYEDNPLINLRSVESRLIGEWELVSGFSTYQVNDYSSTTTIEDGQFTTVTVYSEDNNTYSASLDIKDDGFYDMRSESGESVDETSGFWALKNSTKNKQLLALDGINKYKIKRLTSKELVVYLDTEFTEQDEDGTDEGIDQEEYFYKKIK